MKNNFYFKNSIQSKYLDKRTQKNFNKKFDKLISLISKDISKMDNILNVLNKNYKFNFNFSELGRFKNYKKIIVIGMGGSILGAETIYEFLLNKIKKEFLFFDDLNDYKIYNAKKKIKSKATLFLIISKSGNTIETISNLIFLKIIKKNSKNIIIISEKKNNFLYSLVKKYNLFYIEHNKNIGGRYSVLSEVGIVPAFLMGVNIKKLRLNTKKYLDGKAKNFLKESALKLANLLKYRKYKNLIFLNYAPELEKFLYWCQQLIAESLGKKRHGFLPIISNAPKDHHSLLQLYLDGPKDKLFHIFSSKEKVKTKIKINKISNQMKFLNNKSIHQIKIAQKKAITQIFKKNKIPYREIILKELNEETLGELFSYFILETIFVGRLIDINPFNQPAVEQVKISTKKILS